MKGLKIRALISRRLNYRLLNHRLLLQIAELQPAICKSLNYRLLNYFLNNNLLHCMYRCCSNMSLELTVKEFFLTFSTTLLFVVCLSFKSNLFLFYSRSIPTMGKNGFNNFVFNLSIYSLFTCCT
jgi:hypothetical protein